MPLIFYLKPDRPDLDFLFEDMFQLAEDTGLGRLIRCHIGLTLKRLDGLLFIVSKIFRNIDHHIDKFVTCSIAFSRRGVLCLSDEAPCRAEFRQES